MKVQHLAPQQQPSFVDDPFQFLNTAILSKFLNFMSKQRNDSLRKGINNIYGRHYSINYRPAFAFKQQWQQRQKIFDQMGHQQIFQSQKLGYQVYNIVQLLFSAALLWFVALYRLIEFEQWTLVILVIGFLGIGTDCWLHYYLRFKNNKQIQGWQQLLHRFKKELFLSCYFFISMFLRQSSFFLLIFNFLLDIPAVILLYKRAHKLFRHFTIQSYSTQYKHHFKLIDLLVNLITIEHIFAVLMYLISYYNQDNNWLSHIDKSQIIGWERFYYAFYFTSTTMLTIGYGDIIPVNKLQIFCVLVIQLFGVAIFSYVINEIGFTLSSIRKEEEELQQNIYIMSKMSKYYNLEPELANLAKAYLINNKKSVKNIYPSEEKEVLSKLNDDLREAITQENHLNLIKSSLFFVCYWSKRFQVEIAKRIQKKILNPNQYIIQSLGKQRVYIIKGGKIQIYTDNHLGYKKNFKKLLKTIEPNPSAEVCDNIYGYTSIFTPRPLKFNAVSKDFTCVYSISKKNFLECVNNDKMDIQYYFQVKAKIEESKFYEAWEAPAILNIREHYRPNQIFIIKKYVKKCIKAVNLRKDHIIRGTIRSKLRTNENEHEMQRLLSNIEQYTLTREFVELIERKDIKFSTQKTISGDSVFSVHLGFMQHFQAMKEYHRYFRQSNVSNLLKKLEGQNVFISKSMKRNRSKPTLKMSSFTNFLNFQQNKIVEK